MSFFALELQNLYQPVVSDHLETFNLVQKGDVLKISVGSSSTLFLQIDKIENLFKVSTSLSYFEIKASSGKFYSIEFYDGMKLNTLTATEKKFSEIDLGVCTLGEKKAIQKFPSVVTGELITFQIAAGRVHTLVQACHFGTEKNQGPTTVSIKRFLTGYEIDVDDGRGKSVIAVQNIPLIYSYNS